MTMKMITLTPSTLKHAHSHFKVNSRIHTHTYQDTKRLSIAVSGQGSLSISS